MHFKIKIDRKIKVLVISIDQNSDERYSYSTKNFDNINVIIFPGGAMFF